MRVRQVGWSAVLVECSAPLALAAWLAARPELAGAEIVPGASSVLVDGVSSVPLPSSLPPIPVASRLVELPTVYDGEDLSRVAGLLSLTPDEVVRQHSETEFTVAFCGFAPGFGYLTGLPWSVPRLPSPRPRVPAGSVALAGPYTGVYPSASPGGWLLIGRTSARLFDVDASPPAVLAPGTRVRFLRA
jgi:KipI family sensor histidine kinase inhibitor